jgi:hypothetical protein
LFIIYLFSGHKIINCILCITIGFKLIKNLD